MGQTPDQLGPQKTLGRSWLWRHWTPAGLVSGSAGDITDAAPVGRWLNKVRRLDNCDPLPCPQGPILTVLIFSAVQADAEPELTHLSETSRSGNQVSEYISQTFLGELCRSLPRPDCRDRKREEKESLLLQSSTEEDRTRHRHPPAVCGKAGPEGGTGGSSREEGDIKS